MAVATLILGLALGALAAWLVLRSRAEAARERLRADLEVEKRVLEERIAAATAAQEDVSTAFKAICADALRENNTSFLELARSHLETLQTKASADLAQRQQAVESLVTPVRESLTKFDQRVQELERARTEAYGSLSAHVRMLAEGQKELRAETANLVTALRSPVVRGRWGEMQLRRVVEMAGMLSHCDFLEQTTHLSDGRALRPDLVVRLPGGKNVVVDAKAPLQAYLEALEAREEDVRRGRLVDHARQIRDHIAKLSAKSYWAQFESTPEFVVLFIPGETFFSAALEADPGLIEEGVNQQVILATPTTLIALLRAVAYGWRQETLAENAAKIKTDAQDLYTRLRTLGEHVAKLGRSLDGAVRAYNETVGSLEQRVLPGARRFKEHGAAAGEIAPLAPIERAVRPVQAPELAAADDAPALTAAAAADAA